MGARTIAMAALLAGCAGGRDKDAEPADAGDAGDDHLTTLPDPDPDPDPTGDTGAGMGELQAADCVLTDHPLVVDCTATLSGPGVVQVGLAAVDATDRAFVSDGLTATPDVLGWGLEPDTAYDWSIVKLVDGAPVGAPITGTVTTGSLPDDLAGAHITTTGAAWGFDAVLRPLTCGDTVYFVMIEPDGDIVWFVTNDEFSGQLDGYDWSQADRTVMSVDPNAFVEQHVSGETVRRLEQGRDFEGSLHHDVARWGPYTYLLHERVTPGLDVDGVHVYDGNTIIGTFFLGDWYDTSIGGGFFGDWAHSNAVKVTDDGVLVMSLLNFDTVLGIDGDPASPTFLELLWQVSGGRGGLPDPTYVAVNAPGEGFAGQHNASVHGDELWVFDNEGQSRSRAVRLLFDDVAGEVRVDASWSWDLTCPVQGGAIPLEGGGVLTTCALNRVVAAFQEGASAPGWTLEADCDANLFSDAGINRGIPVWVQ